MPFVYYDTKETSMNPPATIAEEYIGLWCYSSSSGGTTTTTTTYLQKGTTSPSSTLTSPTKLLTLSTSWVATQKFAFEASIYTNGASDTANAVLYDVTSGATVSASLISTNANTFTVVRSASFTLTPGHVYAVGVYTTGANNTYLTKARLVALGG